MSRSVPGPRSARPLGSLHRLRRDPLAFYRELAAEYGPFARFRIGPYAVHLVNDPEAIGEVLMNDVDRFYKGFGNQVLEPLIGQGLFLAEGERWREQRRLAQPLFQRTHLDQLAPVVERVTTSMLDDWEGKAARGESFDLFHELRECTLRITSLGIVGMDLFESSPELRATLEDLWRMTNERAARGFPWVEALFLRRHARFRRATSVLDAALHAAARARADADSRDFDLLGVLTAARMPNGRGLSGPAIRDELVTFLIAGQECTAIALAWALQLLLEHPKEEERLRSDPRRTKPVIEEALRLYPPAWMMARQTNAAESLCGYTLPRNTVLLISPWVTHRDPRFWDDPERFEPDRFAADRPKPAPFTYIPFAAGPRTCIGRPFALMLATTILPAVLARFRLSLIPGQCIEPAPQLTLRPKHGIRVTAQLHE